MNACLVERFAVPFESSACENDLHVVFVEDLFPKRRDLFALRDRVRAYKGGFDVGAGHEFCGEMIPRANVVDAV